MHKYRYAIDIEEEKMKDKKLINDIVNNNIKTAYKEIPLMKRLWFKLIYILNK